LYKLTDSCDFHNITPDEILRDHPVFGIADDKLSKTLLREFNPTLSTTDEVCRVSETMNEQMKTISCDPDSVNVVRSYKAQHTSQSRKGDSWKQNSSEKVNQQCVSVGTAAGNMYTINECCTQPLARHVTSVIN